MIKLLHVNASMDPKLGGISQAIKTIICGLEKLNVYNEVVSLDAKDALFLKNFIFPVNAIGQGKGRWYYHPKLSPWLLENLPKFDVVIIHGLWLYPSFAVANATRKLFKNEDRIAPIPKVFVMPHGMLDPYFQRAPERKLKALRNLIYWKLIEKKVVNEADGILFTCKEELKLAKESFHPYHPKREEIVGLGVENPPTFTAGMEKAFLEICPSLQNRRYFLFLSRIHEKKGVDILIKAYVALLLKISHRKAFLSEEFLPQSGNMIDQAKEEELPVLVIAGPGLESPFGLSVQALVAEYKVPKGAVLFPGMLSGNEKWGAFYGCEAFVLPSHQENYGIAVVEAMACGKPVLISNQVNIWKEIENVNGGFVAPDTLDGTLILLKSWISLNKENKKNMGVNSKACYKDKFCITKNAVRLKEVIS